MGGTANPFLMILWFVIPFLFLFYAYLVLFSTSSYLIVQILKLRKNGTLTKGQCILHIMMQLLFFIDVVDSVYLFFKYRKCNWIMKSIAFATDPFTSHLYSGSVLIGPPIFHFPIIPLRLDLRSVIRNGLPAAFSLRRSTTSGILFVSPLQVWIGWTSLLLARCSAYSSF